MTILEVENTWISTSYWAIPGGYLPAKRKLLVFVSDCVSFCSVRGIQQFQTNTEQNHTYFQGS